MSYKHGYESKSKARHEYTSAGFGFRGRASIDRKKPMNFKGFKSAEFYSPYTSRYSDAPPIHTVGKVLNQLESGEIGSQEIGDLSQWVFETAGDFIIHGGMDEKSIFRLRDCMVDVASILAHDSQAIFRQIAKDGEILPLKIVSGWWKERHVNIPDHWITESPIATEERVLSKDTKWPTTDRVKGVIYDVGLVGCLYIAYSMRVDDEKNHNIYAVPAYVMSEYLNTTDESEYRRMLGKMIKIMLDHEKAVAATKIEETASYTTVQEAKPTPKPGHVPTETTTAKYEIGMFG